MGLDLSPGEPQRSIEPVKVAGSALAFTAFTSERKKRFLDLAKDYWPDIAHICEVVGVSRVTFYNHKKSDPQFNKSLHDIDNAICDNLELTLRAMGSQPKGFLDRMAYLRAHRPELYDRAKVVRVEGWKMGDGEKVNRLAGLEGAIDGEIVKTGLDRKAKRDYAKQRALKQGERGSGG